MSTDAFEAFEEVSGVGGELVVVVVCWWWK